MTIPAWRNTVRIALVLQLATIASIVAMGQDWIGDASSTMLDQLPKPIEWFATYCFLWPGVIITFYGFPLWAMIPAWKGNLTGWTFLLLLIVELALWGTLIFATLPMVQ